MLEALLAAADDSTGEEGAGDDMTGECEANPSFQSAPELSRAGLSETRTLSNARSSTLTAVGSGSGASDTGARNGKGGAERPEGAVRPTLAVATGAG